MPDFSYIVKSEDGRTIKGSLNSANKDAAVEQLQKQDYFIVKINPIKLNSTAKTKSSTTSSSKKSKNTKKFPHVKITSQDKLNLAHQLAAMLEAGLNLLRSLTICIDQTESQKLYEILSKILKDVEQGSTFSSGLAEYPKTFGILWSSLVEVGETAGTMPKVLEKIASYSEKAETTKSAITSALIYPCILLAVTCLAIAIFALVIGPKFEDMYGSMGADLPALTTILLNLFKIIRSNFLIFLIAAVAFVAAIKKYISTPIGRIQLEKLLFKIPVLNKMILVSIVEKFASQMAILIDSGVPLLYSLDIIERLIGNKICEKHVIQIKTNVREGKMLSEEMEKVNFFPSMAIQMIAVGEETGEMSKMFIHIANYYQRVLTISIKNFTAMFEPVMMIFMGGTIGTIVIAMFLPILNIVKMIEQ